MVEIAVPAVALVVGLLLVTMAWGNRTYERQRRARGVVLVGRVVDAERDMNSQGAEFWAPVVEYVDPAGATQRFTHRSGSTLRPTAGTPVSVWIDPSTGEGPRLHEDRSAGLVFGLFGVVGIVLTVGAAVALVGALR